MESGAINYIWAAEAIGKYGLIWRKIKFGSCGSWQLIYSLDFNN